MTRSYWIAAAIALAVAGWLASGMLLRNGADRAGSTQPEPRATLVAVRSSHARPVTRMLLLQGDVRAARTSAVPAETNGRVKAIYAREGERVALGERLLELTLEARLASRREAEAQIAQLTSELEGAKTLSERGFAATQRVQKLEAALETAKAQLARISEEIADTEITAPYDGVLNHIAVEHNQYVTVGTVLATMVDNAVLRVGVNVAQQDISSVERGGDVEVEFATGATARGRVCFVSASAASQSRTFLVEVWVPNSEQQTPSGISADVRLPLGTRSGHLVSPAVLSLDDRGRLGIKAVDDAGIVVFHPVEIVSSDDDGVWVAGAPPSLRLITTGQGFVTAGERVRVGPQDEQVRAGEARSGAGGGKTHAEQAERSGAAERSNSVPSCEDLRATITTAADFGAASGGPTARSP